MAQTDPFPAFSLCCLSCQYRLPRPTQMSKSETWGSSLLDSLLSLFPHIQFTTKSCKFYLQISLKYTQLYFIPTTTIISHLGYWHNLLFLYLKFDPIKSIIQIAATAIFLKYKSDQWCCSSTWKTFNRFQGFSIQSRIQYKLVGPWMVLTESQAPIIPSSNPWEDQCHGKQGGLYPPYYLPPNTHSPLPLQQREMVMSLFSVLELKTHSRITVL